MRVTLRRAADLARAALAAANQGKYDTKETISVYAPEMADPAAPDAAEALVADARQRLLDQHARSIGLIAACYTIRGQLAVANQTYRVSINLTRNAQYAMEEARLTALLTAATERTRGATSETSATVALTKAAALRAMPRDNYLSERDTVKVELLNAADIERLQRQLKRIATARSILGEVLTAANVSNTITLDETTVATLRRADLLPDDDQIDP